MSKLRVLDLFSGIGGFSLGLERTGGFETVAFCEIEPFPRQVLAKHWPGVPIYDDVRTLTGDVLARDGIGVDVICGGFPCQDLSEAGIRAGIDGMRSGLWRDFRRLIGEVRPRYALVENVPALLNGNGGRWFSRVIGDLAALGYDAVWNCIQAADLGAPHIRDRLWLTAFLPDATFERFEQCWREQFAKVRAPAGDVSKWSSEPEPTRVADGVSDRMVQIRALGNAVVPQIPELIGRAILAARGTAIALVERLDRFSPEVRQDVLRSLDILREAMGDVWAREETPDMFAEEERTPEAKAEHAKAAMKRGRTSAKRAKKPKDGATALDGPPVADNEAELARLNAEFDGTPEPDQSEPPEPPADDEDELEPAAANVRSLRR